MNQGHKIKSFVFNRPAKCTIFVLIKLQGLDCTSLPKLSLSVPLEFQLGVYFLAAVVLHGILL